MPSRRRARLRAALAGNTCARTATVWDPVSARIAEDIGFEVGILAGSIASMTVLGAPDLIVLTLSELAEQARRIGRGSELPLFVDADHGYGNALNTMRTIEELEAAGVAGMSIEDTELPQPYGLGARQRLIPIEEAAGKMRAAVAARRDPGLVIAGRTNGRATDDFADILARVRAYSAAGVDAIFVVGLRSAEQLAAVAAATTLPIIVGGGTPGVSHDGLAAHRVRVSIQPHIAPLAAIQAVHDTLAAQIAGADPAASVKIAPPALVARVTREDDYQRRRKDFAGD
ncbi:MAG: oxaloacetate decarboxylase [Alphaproteobacteria bacterium]